MGRLASAVLLALATSSSAFAQMPVQGSPRVRGSSPATAPVKMLDPGYWSREALIGLAIDISPDGKRFLVVTPPRDVADPPELVVIQHWDQELEARVPGK